MGVVTALAGVAVLAVGAQPAGHGVVDYGYQYSRGCPGAGLVERVDRWKMYECNCTSYVAWALTVNGQRTDWFVPGAMDARNWPRVARLAGIPIGRTARVGAVAVWPHSSPFGHVAYVIAVDRGGRFDVAEYNLPGPGGEAFEFDTRTGVPARGATFIYVPRARDGHR